jgi:hypothetical protein
MILVDPNSDDNSENEIHNSGNNKDYCPTMPEKKDIMDKDDDSETPCQVTRRAAKCVMVISQMQDQPPAQCAKIVHHRVSHITVYLNLEC